MPSSSSGLIRLFVLGDARIETPVAVIEPSAEVAFAAALYLLLERREPVSRRALERLLWPDVSGPAASHRLRQTLLKLRHLGIPVTAFDKSRLHVSAADIIVDVESLLASPKDIESVPPSRFVLFPEYSSGFSEDFRYWLDSKQHDMCAMLTSSILPIVSRHRLRANWESVESWAKALLQLAPYNEEGTLALAEAHAARGAKLEAYRILDRYLDEIGPGSADLRLPAAVMRKRIAEKMPSRPQQPSVDNPMIGRGETINFLAEMLPLVKSGHGQSCLLYGESGIGKTKVFAEFANLAALHGFSCLRVQCRPHDAFRPLSVFVDLVPTLRSMRGAIGCSPETMKHLDRLTKLNQLPSSPISIQGDAEFAYASIQVAVFDLLDAVADESSLFILVEDIQRMDEASLTLLGDLLGWSTEKRIFFAFTGRDSSPRLAARASHLRLMKLQPLDEDASREIMVRSVGQFNRNISEDYLAWCVRVAEGNPYFLTELANHWVQTGERQEAPPSLTAVIEQRLARLEGPALQLLQACALLENNSTLDRIEQTLGYPQHVLLQCINDLSALGMIVLDSREGAADATARLSPRHELLAAAAEKSLNPPAKAFLHRRIGIILESDNSENDSSATLWDSAKHWRQAGNFARAFQVAQSWAKHLMDLGLCAEAAKAYEKAFAFCTSDGQRLEILQGQAHAYFRASDWQNLSSAAADVRELKKRLMANPSVHDDVELMEIRAEWQRGGQKGTLEKTMCCLNDSVATIDHRCRAGIMALMLTDHACDLDGMKKTYELLSPLLNDERAEPSHRYEAGMVFETVSGDLRKSLPLAEALIAARRRSNSIADLMRALTNGATAARTAGHYAEAKSWLKEAIALAEAHKLPLATEVPCQILASMALDDNDMPEARAWHSRLVRLPESVYNTSSRTVKNSIGLRICLSEHDVQGARNLIQPDLIQLASDSIPYRRAYGLALLIAVELAEKEVPDQETTERLETSHLIARRSARQGFATCVLVAALRRSGRAKRGNQLLNEYLKVYRREPSPAPLHVLELMDSFKVRSARH